MSRQDAQRGPTRKVASEELLARRRARAALLRFTVATHPAYMTGWHHHEICRALERVEAGQCKRLMIFAPPRHGKSELVSIRFPAWYLGRNPNKQVISCSYGDDLANDFGRKVRNLVASEDYARIFPDVVLTADSRAANRWNTSHGGSYVASGYGGALTGRGADVLIIDDPIKNREEADSQRYRDKLWSIYESDLQSRLMPGGSIVVMHTRFHDDDLAGRLLSRQDERGERWEVLKFRAIEHQDTPDEQALWPEWYTLADMKARRSSVTARTWASLYQQEPTADEGTFFLAKWFVRYRLGDEPKNLHVYMTSDFAVTADGGDYTEHAVWGVDEHSRLWALDWWSGQDTADVWVERLLDLAARHKPLAWFGEAGVIRRAIEPLITKRCRERACYFRQEWVPSLSAKDIRARAFQGMASMGLVHIPAVPFGDRLVEQLLRFPAGRYDDAVDCCSTIGMVIDQAHPAIARHQQPKPARDAWADKMGGRSNDSAWKVA